MRLLFRKLLSLVYLKILYKSTLRKISLGFDQVLRMSRRSRKIVAPEDVPLLEYDGEDVISNNGRRTLTLCKFKEDFISDKDLEECSQAICDIKAIERAKY